MKTTRIAFKTEKVPTNIEIRIYKVIDEKKLKKYLKIINTDVSDGRALLENLVIMHKIGELETVIQNISMIQDNYFPDNKLIAEFAKNLKIKIKE